MSFKVLPIILAVLLPAVLAEVYKNYAPFLDYLKEVKGSPMEWDEDLAASAATKAAECKNVVIDTDQGKYYGFNYDENSLMFASHWWYDSEYKMKNCKGSHCDFFKEVKENSGKIGCGFEKCDKVIDYVHDSEGEAFSIFCALD